MSRTLVSFLAALLAFSAPALTAQESWDSAAPEAANPENQTPEAEGGSTPDASNPESSDSEEPSFLEKGGALDEAFGVALENFSEFPFFDLLLNSDPPFPYTAPDGTVYDEAAFKEFKKTYGKFRQNGGEAGEWKDKDGDTFILSVTGDPQQVTLPFVVLWLVFGAVFFTLMMKFVNFRMFGHAIQVVRGRYDNPDDHGEVSHFQALASALSATVGLGNIAGVAIAISIGGPGATFWMICAGLLGMTLKFTECTLGQMFRKVDDRGRVSGGPMHYLKDGLQQKGYGALGTVLALIFTIFCIGGSLAGGNSFQVNQSLGLLAEQVPWLQGKSEVAGLEIPHGGVYGLILSVLVGIVIIGGVRRIAQTAEKIVPTMCGIYVVSALLVIFANVGEIPSAIGAIVGDAFGADALYGGAIGTLVVGFQRAAFSNEAGVGSASIAHSAARTEYPVREGIVALLEPLIDTVLVCTMTALVIVITGVYDPAGPQGELVATKAGAALTGEAFDSVSWLSGWFKWVLTGAAVMFAFSTMISWSYYGERCWVKLFGQGSSMSYKMLFLVFVVLGSIVSATNVLEFGDLMILSMAFPNILGLYFLGGLVKNALTDYEHKLRSGEMKTYD
ncbi:MAG: alanine/glycine:cation symporter family protein [Planctomycetota bacterium]